MTRPVQRLLAGTRAVEAGDLHNVVEVTSKDEIGHLTAAFNRMVEQLRLKERIRETFGKYVDPRVVSALIARPDLAQADGERRVMTVLFCDMKGFASGSQQMTPQGLVRVMNRYLSTMSEPIHHRHGIIDKYIGDAIMAYWGPPFTDEADHARLACLAALDMTSRVAGLQKELPELLGVRVVPMTCDIRIGIATGEVVVGSIGSQHMMSYTVMGDTVNLASRLDGLEQALWQPERWSPKPPSLPHPISRSARSIASTVAGQTIPERIFEIIGPKGEISPAQATLRTHYSNGLAAYREARWDDARAAFASPQRRGHGRPLESLAGATRPVADCSRCKVLGWRLAHGREISRLSRIEGRDGRRPCTRSAAAISLDPGQPSPERKCRFVETEQEWRYRMRTHQIMTRTSSRLHRVHRSRTPPS